MFLTKIRQDYVGIEKIVYGFRGTLTKPYFRGDVYRVPGQGYSYVNYSGLGADTSDISFVDLYVDKPTESDIQFWTYLNKNYCSIINDYYSEGVLVHSLRQNLRRTKVSIPVTTIIDGDEETNLTTYYYAININASVEVLDYLETVEDTGGVPEGS